MSVPIYLDNNASARIAQGLRLRGVDVITAREDGTWPDPDESILERATSLGRLVYSEDADFLAIAARWRQIGRDFAGIAYSRPRRLSAGALIESLELIAKVYEPQSVRNEIFFLPI